MNGEPRALLARAETELQTGRVDAALDLLEKARDLLASDQDPAADLRCHLLLARVHYLREDLSTAQLYTEEAAALLHTHEEIITPGEQAEALMGLAMLAPDVGRLRAGLTYAQEALALYEAAGDVEDQVAALLLAAAIARQMGRLQQAGAWTEVGRRRLQAAQVGRLSPLWIWLCNGEAHQAWYQGRLEQALSRAEEAVRLADRAGLAKQQLYNRLLRANLLRELGRFHQAEQAYQETETALQEAGFHLYAVWLWTHRAWLAALQDDYAQTRRLLYRALDQADQGQAASINVFLAAVYSLTGRETDAEGLLQSSLHYYQTSGDELSVFALRVHLAYILLRTGRVPEAEQHLALALGWAAHWNQDFFPHWWHPQIVGAACVHALVAGIHPGMAERILVKRVGADAAALLRALLAHEDPTVVRRAQDALSLIEPTPPDLWPEDMEPPIAEALLDLLHRGHLRGERLEELAARLATGRRGASINPVLLAAFGMYTAGHTRQTIARALGRKEATIRNYITLIYERFDLADTGGSWVERKAQLIRRAVEEGYIAPGRE